MPRYDAVPFPVSCRGGWRHRQRWSGAASTARSLVSWYAMIAPDICALAVTRINALHYQAQYHSLMIKQVCDEYIC